MYSLIAIMLIKNATEIYQIKCFFCFFKYLIIKKKYAWYKLNVHQSSKCHCSIIICTLLLCNKITCKIYIISN